jgi:quinol monooxygenase YgiN
LSARREESRSGSRAPRGACAWAEPDRPTRFVHIFVFRDEAADEAHSASAAVKKFASILYPECLAPVEFIDYTQVAANVDPWGR